MLIGQFLMAKNSLLNKNKGLSMRKNNWYIEMNSYINNLSYYYHISPLKIAGILSALSPNNTVRNNVISLEKFLRTKGNCKVTTFNCQKNKALEIYNFKDPTIEDIKKILKGPKTVAFFVNIYDPTDCNYVTIDLWINRYFKNDGKAITSKKYKEYSEIIKNKSKKIGILPHEYQAYLWEKLRGKKF